MKLKLLAAFMLLSLPVFSQNKSYQAVTRRGKPFIGKVDSVRVGKRGGVPVTWVYSKGIRINVWAYEATDTIRVRIKKMIW